MAEQVRAPKSVTREQFLEAVRTGVHDAMCERPRVLAAASLLPCINCRRGGRALEEVAAAYAALLHGERPPRELDDRPLPYLPRTCCRQVKPDAGAMVAKTPT
jgi:hypothetical protein